MHKDIQNQGKSHTDSNPKSTSLNKKARIIVNKQMIGSKSNDQTFLKYIYLEKSR